MQAPPAALPVLVLNADFRPLSYLPLSLWPWQDAVKAVFSDRVNVVSEYETTVRSPSFEMKVPSVICLREYIPHQRTPAFTRFNILLRDAFECSYCGHDLSPGTMTLDHLIPRARGGKTSWDNVLAACGPCNARKGSKTLRQVGMKLRHEPYSPSVHDLQAIARRFPPRFIHDSWRDFLDFEDVADDEGEDDAYANANTPPPAVDTVPLQARA